MNLPRRQFCSYLLGGLAAACTASSVRAALGTIRQRNYRADVVVTLLGVPIFSRQGVGSAACSLHEAEDAGRKSVSLHFAGGSDPVKAHGIVYAGSTEEMVVERNSATVEASCFGFVTSTHDESFEQARKRVMAESPKASTFVAVEAKHQSGRVLNNRALIAFPEKSWNDWRDLTPQVRSRFGAQGILTRELNFPGESAPPTFLYSVLRAARAQGRSEWTYVHNAKQYRLECEKSRDPRVGASLAAKNLTSCADNVIRFAGRIHDSSNGSVSTFRCWMEEGSDLPLRIEFQPRSYLRISLEKEEA